MENWKLDIFNSMKGAQRAQPDPRLYRSIQERIASSGKMTVLPRSYMALAAACFAILLSANIWALRQNNTTASGAAQYQLELADFDVY